MTGKSGCTSAVVVLGRLALALSGFGRKWKTAANVLPWWLRRRLLRATSWALVRVGFWRYRRRGIGLSLFLVVGVWNGQAARLPLCTQQMSQNASAGISMMLR